MQYEGARDQQQQPPFSGICTDGLHDAHIHSRRSMVRAQDVVTECRGGEDERVNSPCICALLGRGRGVVFAFVVGAQRSAANYDEGRVTVMGGAAVAHSTADTTCIASTCSVEIFSFRCMRATAGAVTSALVWITVVYDV